MYMIPFFYFLRINSYRWFQSANSIPFIQNMQHIHPSVLLESSYLLKLIFAKGLNIYQMLEFCIFQNLATLTKIIDNVDYYL